MHEVKLPQLGQSVEEASIVRWLKSEGDSVAKGEPLLAVQTDKAEIECESPASGTLRKILVATDIIVPVMTVIALVGGPDEALPDLAKFGTGGSSVTKQDGAPKEHTPEAATPLPHSPMSAASAGAVSPRARRRADALHLDPGVIAGSGVGGRVMEADVLSHAESAGPASPTAKRTAQQSGIDISTVAGSGPRGKIMKKDVAASKIAAVPVPARESRRVALTPMRKIIAKRMADSKFTAPHYYVTIEVDMANAVQLRKTLAWKPSYNDIVMRATAVALQQFPGVNARWHDDAIEEVGAVNLGFAVALPTGLIVPVVRDAQAKSLQEISVDCKALTERARTGKLLPDDYAGNTFTISNLGGFGVDHFTAIINQPDSAILAVGQMKDRVVVIEGGMHIRPIMKLTLSSDHRVIDGALAAQFMGHLKELLEQAQL
ncbi:MAG: dihydrolipoamide acetyltransferase family protein [Candidatus Hydrogenedentes bacterium]|nr:dihydrolipoamide acetyltransferase family protein [Candidatus Hydrogenedentota bacterium]